MAQLSKKQKPPKQRPSARKAKRVSPSLRKKPVKKASKAHSPANDNKWTSLSDLPWKKQAVILNRMADLQWQINFTQMKLKRWTNLDNGAWTYLQSLNRAAKAELKDLTYA